MRIGGGFGCQCLIEQCTDRRRFAGRVQRLVNGLGGVKHAPHDLGGRFRWVGTGDCSLERGEDKPTAPIAPYWRERVIKLRLSSAVGFRVVFPPSMRLVNRCGAKMRFSRLINVVGVHAEGEHNEVITGGVIDVPGRTMFDKMIYLRTQADELRQFLLHEPRGKVAQCVNLVSCTDQDGSGDAGFIIMEFGILRANER